MPSLEMKTKLCKSSLGGKSCLHMCQKSDKISKSSFSSIRSSQCMTELETCSEDAQDGSDVSVWNAEPEGPELVGENFQFQMQPPSLADLTVMGRMDFAHSTSPNVQTIFSPAMNSVDLHDDLNVHSEADGQNDDLPQLRSDDSDDNCRNSCELQNCNISDFLISDMIVADLPLDGNTVYDDLTGIHSFPDLKCTEQGMLFDVAERYMMLPFCEDTAGMSKANEASFLEEVSVDSDESSLYLAIDQVSPGNQDCDGLDLDQEEHLELPPCKKSKPNSSETLWSTTLPKETQRKPITLVLDLDETLVHSTLEPSDDADFTFQVFFNMKEETVYVKQRPFLRTFLERVAEMFEIIIFTASQSIYAKQLLDRLDPDGNLISRRAYRESCIFSNGGYTKDLTVLGVDLAKVAIVDNSPQVFRLQVNNGIPIESWFDDPSDRALITLLPFLETLANADDVRPLIAKKFGNKE